MKLLGFEIKRFVEPPVLERVSVSFTRGGRMTDQELALKLNVMDDHHVLQGVQETIDRLEDSVDDELTMLDVPAERSSRLAAYKFAIREVRKHVAMNVQAARKSVVSSRQ